jgi:hypothetical protein
MTYKGKVKCGVVVVDEPGRLPEGAEVRIEVISDLSVFWFTRNWSVRPRALDNLPPSRLCVF